MMQKSTFLFSAFLLFAALLSAQQASVGIRAGYTCSDVLIIEPDGFALDGNPDAEIDGKFRPLSSFHAGIDARMPLGEGFGIVASLLYARKGYMGEVYWPTGPAEATWELHYLNLPVVADFSIWNGLSLQGGMELGRLVNARLKSAEEEGDSDVFFENFDLGLIAGLEYRHEKGFFIGARHIFGIYNIQEIELTNGNGGALGTAKSRNSATQLSVGYRHALGQ